jgi:hypothetical protein
MRDADDGGGGNRRMFVKHRVNKSRWCFREPELRGYFLRKIMMCWRGKVLIVSTSMILS